MHYLNNSDERTAEAPIEFKSKVTAPGPTGRSAVASVKLEQLRVMGGRKMEFDVREGTQLFIQRAIIPLESELKD